MSILLPIQSAGERESDTTSSIPFESSAVSKAQKDEPMGLYQVDPLRDVRWAQLVETHSKSSIFHTVAWLEALRRTYGYEPVAFTTSAPADDLKNGLVFCHVKSWLTGNRLVSLPFSDHCEPLCNSTEELNFLTHHLQTAFEDQQWKYVELRPIDSVLGQEGSAAGFQTSAAYFLHRLDLRPDLDTVFQGLDKDSVQRRILRAERAGLVEKCGTTEDLLKDFYKLLIMTRSRHSLPPQPYAWFQTLIHCQGNALGIRVAYKDENPIAAVLLLRFRSTVYYKYGCSDVRFNRFGATPLLLWRAIAAAKSAGAVEFDMGRTEQTDTGLLAFKNHWNPQPKSLLYWRIPGTRQPSGTAGGWKLRMAKRIFSCIPDSLLPITGNLIYRHIG
jgi:GNAT acetyltransferase-like protein